MASCATGPDNAAPADDAAEPTRQELAEDIAALQEELTRAERRVEELLGQNEELREGAVAAEAEAQELSRRLAELERQFGRIRELTDADTNPAALAEVEGLVVEVEALQELVEDQLFLQGLLDALQAPRPDAAPVERPGTEVEESPRPRQAEETAREPVLEAEPLRQAEPPGPPPVSAELRGSFISVEETESAIISGLELLPGEAGLLRSTDPPGRYVPEASLSEDLLVTPVLIRPRDGVAYLALWVRVRYPAADPPLYLESIEVATAETTVQISLEDLRRQVDASRRLEETIIAEPGAVRRVTELLRRAQPPRITFHGRVRSLHKTAPQDMRGRMALMVYTLRALGGELP